MNRIILIKSVHNSWYTTCLRLFDNERKVWEWDKMWYPSEFLEDRKTLTAQWVIDLSKKEYWDLDYFALNVPYNTLDVMWLKSYILAFEKILCLEETDDLKEFPIKWLTNDAEFRMRARRKSRKEIELDINCKNKHRLTYDEFDMSAFWWWVPADYEIEAVSDYNWKPEEYSRVASKNYPVEYIEQYLEELIEEYEEVSWEKYLRLNTQLYRI